MPHTSRRHRNHVSSNPLRAAHGKRVQITDDDGWVHVINTSSTSASSPQTKPKTYTSPTTDGSADDPDCSTSNKEHQKQAEKKGKLPQILPAEAPPRLTLAMLRRKFDTDLAAWQISSTWTTLRDSLLRILANSPAASNIDRLVCIGLGSPSGLRDGWVDRRDVASYQLAAFVSVVQVVQEQQQAQQASQTGETATEIIAQDPIFNTLDIQLLGSLGITVVPTPQAFSRVSAQTLLFAPGAEKRHLELVLPARPVVLFGGPLEEDGGSRFLQTEKEKVIEQFLTNVQSVKLVEFGPRPEAFWRMRVYWRGIP